MRGKKGLMKKRMPRFSSSTVSVNAKTGQSQGQCGCNFRKIRGTHGNLSLPPTVQVWADTFRVTQNQWWFIINKGTNVAGENNEGIVALNRSRKTILTHMHANTFISKSYTWRNIQIAVCMYVRGICTDACVEHAWLVCLSNFMYLVPNLSQHVVVKSSTECTFAACVLPGDTFSNHKNR